MDINTANSVSNIFVTQFTSSAVVVWFMQKLKNASWFPFLQHGQATMSRIFSAACAAAVAIGINYTWNPQTRGLLITVPTISAALVGGWHWLNQFVLQETVYQATVNKLAITTRPNAGPTIPAQVDAAGKVVVPDPSTTPKPAPQQNAPESGSDLPKWGSKKEVWQPLDRKL